MGEYHTLIVVVLLVFVLIMALMLGFILRIRKSMQRNVDSLLGELEGVRKFAISLQDGLDEAQAGNLGLGKTVKALQQQLEELSRQIQQLAEMDPDSRHYVKAAKLVEAGASVEEIMQDCDLPRAEAELLVSIHNKSTM